MLLQNRRHPRGNSEAFKRCYSLKRWTSIIYMSRSVTGKDRAPRAQGEERPVVASARGGAELSALRSPTSVKDLIAMAEAQPVCSFLFKKRRSAPGRAQRKRPSSDQDPGEKPQLVAAFSLQIYLRRDGDTAGGPRSACALKSHAKATDPEQME